MIKTEAFIHCYSGRISSECAYLDLNHVPFNHEITDIELVFSTVKITQLKLQKFLKKRVSEVNWVEVIVQFKSDTHQIVFQTKRV